MKIFLAGATGVVGRSLVPLLRTRGHQIIATTRAAEKTAALRELGAEPTIVDPLDREGVMRAVESAAPDVVVHQLTALGHMRSLKRFDDEFAVTNRLRTQGVDYLLEAAQSARAARFVAQSFTGWPNIREGARVKTENDPLDPHPPASMQRTLDAIRHLERAATGAPGIEAIVLRYGYFYGPGTALAPDGDIFEAVRRRQLPIVGSGAGVWSFIHVHDVAAATAIAIEGVPPGLYNIVDDEPAEVATWLPELARTIGAKPPRHLPAWIGRLAIGDAGVAMMTESRGSSNAKAKRVFEWQLTYPSWRDGFRHDLSNIARDAASAAA
jgi:nucleoside-diphosphate-sugar epimerase